MSREGQRTPTGPTRAEEAYNGLTKGARDLVDHAPRGEDPLPLPQRFAVAYELTQLGVNLKLAPVRDFCIRRLKRSLGLGSVPTPPDLPRAEYEFVEAKLNDAGKRLVARYKTK